ncbi:hypothetical protein SAE02_13100 [Skermanella aerolata]|uniref:Uncharacterized protein n=1 Tax=Skermanella aerolata TaxID=393310 RepID=A0A512DL10_9PROT|nr:hypothetical protein SAE02_13100 [Skermanella aerolata]
MNPTAFRAFSEMNCALRKTDLSALQAPPDAPGGKLVWVPCASSPVALVEIHEGWALVEDAAGQMHAVPADQVDCAETL